MKLRFVYTPKPRQYAYKPQFYNPEDEKEQSKIPDGPGKSTREAFRRWRRDTAKLRNRRNQSILIYIVIILVLLYIIFF